MHESLQSGQETYIKAKPQEWGVLQYKYYGSVTHNSTIMLYRPWAHLYPPPPLSPWVLL